MKTSMNSYHILFDLKNNPFRHMQILTCEDYKLKNVNICLLFFNLHLSLFLTEIALYFMRTTNLPPLP